MFDWTKSATKLVFVILALALIIFTAMGIVSGENFFTIVAMVFTAYYSKTSSKDPPTSTITKVDNSVDL